MDIVLIFADDSGRKGTRIVLAHLCLHPLEDLKFFRLLRLVALKRELALEKFPCYEFRAIDKLTQVVVLTNETICHGSYLLFQVSQVRMAQ